MKTDLHVVTAGAGEPVLVLLHGLGVNGAVWELFLAHLTGWPGCVVLGASAALHNGDVRAFASATWRACRLACGSRDTLVTLDETRTLDPDAIALGDVGHNAHVEDPRRLLDAITFLEEANR